MGNNMHLMYWKINHVFDANFYFNTYQKLEKLDMNYSLLMMAIHESNDDSRYLS